VDGIKIALFKKATMKEIKAGLLMIMVCTAVYLQPDPFFWGGLLFWVERVIGLAH
jgi:hypothetical protein